MRPESFRGRLATRIALTVGVVVVAGSLVVYALLRTTLYDRLDTVLLRLAAIEAAATADSPNESVHFHDDVFVGAGAGHDSVLVRYAEVWTLTGEAVVRSTNLGQRDLPLPNAVRHRVNERSAAETFAIEFGGQEYRSVLYPLGLIGPQHQLHLLQVAVSTRDTDDALARVATFLALLIVAGVGLGAYVAWWLAGYAVRPVVAIIAQAEAMDATKQGHRIAVDADSVELRRLVAVLNALLGRLDNAIATQRQFLADAGHAIRTPLTILRGDVDVALRRERDAAEYRSVLERAAGDLRTVSSLADDLIHLARDEGTVVRLSEVFSVHTLASETVARFHQASSRAGVVVEVEIITSLTVRTDRAMLDRALGNVLDNAIKYSGSGSYVAISARRREDGCVELSVADNGRGIPAAEQARVFERFFRGSEGRQLFGGSGLGLAIARASMRAIGGDLSLASEVSQGTTVRIVVAHKPHENEDT